MTTIFFNDHIHAKGWIAELGLEPIPEPATDPKPCKTLLSPRGEPLVKVNSFFQALFKSGFRLQGAKAISGSTCYVQFTLSDDKSVTHNEKLWAALKEMFGDKPVPRITASKSITAEQETLTISVWNTDPDKPYDTVYLHIGDEKDLYLSYYGTT